MSAAVEEVATEGQAVEAVPKRAMTLGIGTSLTVLALLVTLYVGARSRGLEAHCRNNLRQLGDTGIFRDMGKDLPVRPRGGTQSKRDYQSRPHVHGDR